MVIFDKYDIVFQEVPNEVSLAFTLKGCPNKCKGCHSPHLRETTGKELSLKLLSEILDKYKDEVTAVLFLGGDAYHEELIPLLKLIKTYGLKRAMYSGLDEFYTILVSELDYYKNGSYKSELGGLDSMKTNQLIVKILDDKIENINHLFWK